MKLEFTYTADGNTQWCRHSRECGSPSQSKSLTILLLGIY